VRFDRRWLRSVTAAVAGVMLLAGGGCDRLEHAPKATGEEGRNATLGKLQEIAGRADVTTVYRVANMFDGDYQELATQSDVKVAGYPVRSQVTITREAAQPLLSILTDRNAYGPRNEEANCIFQPREALSVAAGGEVFTVVMSINCREAAFSLGEQPIGSFSILPGPHAEIARILKEMLSAATPVPRPDV
jgi:hypothetical protein